MKFTCIASGSKGNMYILESSTGQRVVLDMGLPWNKIKEVLNHRIEDTFFFCSHEHFDHIKGYAPALAQGAQARAYFKDYEVGQYGEFMVMAFPVLHNVPTHGFLIYHEECGTVCYMTDTTYIPHVFEKVNHWLIEANYCESILEDRAFKSDTTFLYERVLKDHLSIQQCERVLKNQDLSKTESITLLHLSDGNSNEAQFVDRIRKVTGKPTYAAKPGLTLDFTIWA